ncbi:hypothetical protein QBC34DRAFT_443656 [Podospora aff. communis PSN243]|uniref:Ubiquitin 3 binding protein But2 C-terminal domain-containing protein n=1 Tax=Podospora aff. communis PSN243 TaxID=3040156 RepID=A0AAV9G6A9_9PEZI|nr:hypothetical protein QBC34DRAFT_443656 [Podospora aff. communis PSN243]
MASSYSTLPELDPRQNITLEVRRSYPGLEAISSRHRNSSSVLAPPLIQKRSMHFWLLLSTGCLLVAGAIAGSIAGALLSARNSSTNEGSNPSPTVHLPLPSSTASTTPPAESSQTRQTTSTSSATQRRTRTPTATPSPSQTPTLPIRIGNAQGADFKSTISFPDNNSTQAACSYTVILEIDGSENPCGRPFVLSDGFEYVWNGCGGPTWVTWKNPAEEIAMFRALGNGQCVVDEQTWGCGNVTVRGHYKCG